ncbi:hypothetical protein P2G42_13595 [Klebsiella electrica]|uniref:hypothetical protein n=1 Tax=Klebsiella electrica TaxID=1259973 RepID=UPI0025546512|nr:hypothetical protein [Klebsiella electrica]WIO41005.1 hypothetical protein P2G42_13595 [Klebsiella electrica]
MSELTAALATIEKLRAERDQLVAENVAAKKIISECREYFIAGVMNRIRPTNEGYLHMICDTFADETPATNAAIAGIKADGVEEFLKGSQLPYQIATVLADYDNADDETLHHVIWSGQPPEPDGDVWHLEYVSRGNAIVREVLKQLREGAK